MAATPKPALASNHERQVRLLVLLLEAGLPLTSDAIFAAIPEYREVLEKGGGERTPTLEKQFERDREALAATGIEIEAVGDPAAPGDRARWRYRVNEDPEGGATFALSAAEILLIDEATDAWLDPHLRADARQAYVKLLGHSDSGGQAPASAPRTVVSTHPSFAAVRDAVARRQRISFDYVKQRSSVVERRDVDALTVFVHRGRWLLHAYDHARDQERNFLISRILSNVSAHGVHDREAPPHAELIARLEQIATEHRVRVLAREGTDAEVRLSGRGKVVAETTTTGWTEIELHDWDLGLLAGELAGMGAQVQVIEPPEVVADVQGRLAAMLTAHEGDHQ